MQLFGRDLDSETAIVAEIGANHEGDEDKAHDLIHKAADCGVDAVKFQTFVGRKFALPYDAFRRLAETADSCGVQFFSTPLDIPDAEALDPYIETWKVASAEVTHLPLLRFMAASRKPVVLSTGGSSLEQIVAALQVLAASEIVLLHSVPKYPTAPQDANLANMAWLYEKFGLPVGYSDHVVGLDAAKAAACMGAVLIEKHFTDDRNREFRDHKLSADPVEMKELVRFVRNLPIMQGAYERTALPEIEDIRSKRAWRSQSASSAS